jgi:hypothetical protein
VESLWSFSLYPEAGEGGGSLSVRRAVVASGGPPNVVRAREEAARRARARVRRYGTANRLNRLGTLTYRVRVVTIRCACERIWPRSSAGCAMGWRRGRSPICGCRSGIPAGTACTPTSRWAASSRAA